MSNLKPAPLPFSPALVAKLVGDRPAYGKGIARLPVATSSPSCRMCGSDRATRCSYPTCPIEDRLAEQRKPARAMRKALPAQPRRQRRVALPFDRRLEVLAAAIAYLKARCILVTPVDRDALIRRFRISGVEESKMLEDVVSLAITKGFEPELGDG